MFVIMEITLLKHEVAAASFPRVFLGLLFYFQGFDKVFNYKIKRSAGRI